MGEYRKFLEQQIGLDCTSVANLDFFSYHYLDHHNYGHNYGSIDPRNLADKGFSFPTERIELANLQDHVSEKDRAIFIQLGILLKDRNAFVRFRLRDDFDLSVPRILQYYEMSIFMSHDDAKQYFEMFYGNEFGVNPYDHRERKVQAFYVYGSRPPTVVFQQYFDRFQRDDEKMKQFTTEYEFENRSDLQNGVDFDVSASSYAEGDEDWVRSSLITLDSSDIPEELKSKLRPENMQITFDR